MHDDGPDSHIFHERDILHDLFLELIVDHGIAAIFDDERLAVEILYIGQCLYEDCCLVICIKHPQASDQV